MNYEAYDEIKDVEIYSGTSESALIQELSDYIEYQNHIDENQISDEEIKTLDQKSLKKIGIKLFMNRW